mgnify:CR=1 FL=1
MKCIHCGKEIEYNEPYEWFGLDGDFIHKTCRLKIDKEMDDLANMNNEEFYKFMGVSDIMKGVEE